MIPGLGEEREDLVGNPRYPRRESKEPKDSKGDHMARQVGP